MSSFFGCCLRGGADDDAGPATGIHHLEQTGLGSLDRLHPMLGEAVELWLFDNDLEGELDPALAAGRKLELLYLNGNSLVEIADATAAGWPALQELNLSANPGLPRLPTTSTAWTDLRQIYLNGLPLLSDLGPGPGVWSRLKVSDSGCDRHTRVPCCLAPAPAQNALGCVCVRA